MKKLLQTMLVIGILLPWVTQGQTTVTIGTGTTTSYYAPFNNYYKNSWNQCVYPASAIGQSGVITSIAYDCATAATITCTELDIYLGTTSNSEWSSTSDWVDLSNLTLVYSHDNVDIGTTTGWQTFLLDNTFVYDGTENLVVVVAKKTTGYSSTLKWNYTSTSNTCLYRQNDSDVSYFNHPGSATGSRSTYLANIQLSMAPIPADYCYGLSTLTGNNITPSSADISWINHPNSSATAWNIAFGPAGFDLTDSTAGTHLNNVTSSSYSITGLTGTTYYDFYAQSICSASNTSNWKKYTFRTACPAFTDIPFTEDFDSHSGTTSGTTNNLPPCWNYLNTATSATGSFCGYPIIYSTESYANSGSNSLRFYSTSSTSASGSMTAILPAMQNVSTLQMRLSARQYSTTYHNALIIGVMSDPTDASTFVPVDTISPASNVYENFTIYFNTYTGTGSHIALYMPHNGATQYMYVDDITVSAIPTCSEPTDLTVSNITATSATMNYSNGYFGTPESFTVAYRNASDTMFTEISASTDSATLSNLTPNTLYFVQVRKNCSATDQSDWSEPLSFRTGCLPTQSIPYNEDFNTYSASSSYYYINDIDAQPSCWSFLPSSINSGTTSSSPAIGTFFSSTYCYDGNALMLHPYTKDVPVYAILPLFSTGVDQLQINFNYRRYSTSYAGTLELGVMTDPTDNTTFTTLEAINNPSTTWTELEHDFFFDNLNADSTYYVALRYTSNYSSNSAYSNVYIDNIAVTIAPTCKKVRNVEFVSSTTHSAVINWTGNNVSATYTVVYASLTDSILHEVSAPFAPITLTSLTPATNYMVAVRQNCSATDSSELSQPIMFSTNCPASITITPTSPLVENFESAYPPNCWTPIYADAANETDNPMSHVIYPTGGTHMFRFSSYSSNDNEIYQQYLVSPEFTSASSLTCSFDYSNYYQNAEADTLWFGYSATDSLSDFTWIQLPFVTTTSAVASASYPLPTNTHHIAFAYNGDYSYYAFVDNIVVKNPTFHITATPADSTMGTVTGSGSYAANDPVILTATPTLHHHFDQWTSLDTNSLFIGATSNPLQFVAVEDVELTALFAINQYTLTVSAYDPTMGTVTGSGTYNYGDTATISATPAAGYHFVAWNDGNTNASHTVIVNQDMTFSAIFAADQVTSYTLIVLANNDNMGTVTGSGSYLQNDTAILTANANQGFHFVNWNDGNTDSIRIFTVTGNATFIANFTANDAALYTITVLSENSEIGSVTGSGQYAEGSVITLTATPNSHYHFVSWSDGNTSASRVITVTGDATYMASFAINQHNLNVTSNDNAMGTITGSGLYNYGATATLTATAKNGYHLVSWSNGSTDNTITITVTDDATYTAFFAADPVGIDDATANTISIYGSHGNIVVKGAQQQAIYVFDIVGRMLYSDELNTEMIRTFNVPATGAYLVKVGNNMAQRVVIKK